MNQHNWRKFFLRLTVATSILLFVVAFLLNVVSALIYYGAAYRAEFGDAIANSHTYDSFISGISVGMMLCVSVWLIYGIGHAVYRIGIWVYKGLK